MPVYNHPEQLKTMLDSISANTFSDYELLAVDDGSDAETLNLLDVYARCDSRIHIIPRRRFPKGAPTCRNIGLDAARAPYIMFLDADDYTAPHCFAQRVAAMDRLPSLDFLVFPSGIYSNDGTFQPIPHIYAYGYPGLGNDVDLFARRFLPFVVWNNIYRTESLRHACIRWDERLLSLQDADFNVAALTAGLKYNYALNITPTTPDYAYRIGTATSVSARIATQSLQSHARATRRMYEMIRASYGKKFDAALFSGVLLLYNRVMTGGGLNILAARALSDAIRPFDAPRARFLSALTHASRLLSTILPAKTARQLPMLPHLIANKQRRKSKLKTIKQYLK